MFRSSYYAEYWSNKAKLSIKIIRMLSLSEEEYYAFSKATFNCLLAIIFIGMLKLLHRIEEYLVLINDDL